MTRHNLFAACVLLLSRVLFGLNSTAGEPVFDDALRKLSGWTPGQTVPDLQSRLQAVGRDMAANMGGFASFSEGTSGNAIDDGGNDMYDSGNKIKIRANGRYSGQLDYTQICTGGLASAGVGDVQYFTCKFTDTVTYWFAGFYSASNSIDGFSIWGGLGADGSGSVESGEQHYPHAGGSLGSTAYWNKVFNAGDPSVNQLIVVINSAGWTNTHSANTNFGNHTVLMPSGGTPVSQLFYILWAGTSGRLYTDEHYRHVAQSIVDNYLTTTTTTTTTITCLQGNGLHDGRCMPCPEGHIADRGANPCRPVLAYVVAGLPEPTFALEADRYGAARLTFDLGELPQSLHEPYTLAFHFDMGENSSELQADSACGRRFANRGGRSYEAVLSYGDLAGVCHLAVSYDVENVTRSGFAAVLLMASPAAGGEAFVVQRWLFAVSVAFPARVHALQQHLLASADRVHVGGNVLAAPMPATLGLFETGAFARPKALASFQAGERAFVFLALAEDLASFFEVAVTAVWLSRGNSTAAPAVHDLSGSLERLAGLSPSGRGARFSVVLEACVDCWLHVSGGLSSPARRLGEAARTAHAAVALTVLDDAMAEGLPTEELTAKGSPTASPMALGSTAGGPPAAGPVAQGSTGGGSPTPGPVAQGSAVKGSPTEGPAAGVSPTMGPEVQGSPTEGPTARASPTVGSVAQGSAAGGSSTGSPPAVIHIELAKDSEEGMPWWQAGLVALAAALVAGMVAWIGARYRRSARASVLLDARPEPMPALVPMPVPGPPTTGPSLTLVTDANMVLFFQRMLGRASDFRRGADLRFETDPPHTSLRFLHAWKIHSPDVAVEYVARKHRVRNEVANVAAGGRAAFPTVRTALADLQTVPGFDLLDDANEVMLLHGTSWELVLTIAYTGVSEKFSGGLFGQGAYLAENAAKTDQYAIPLQPHETAGEELRQRLFRSCGLEVPTENCFFLFVCTVVLGCPGYTKDGTNTISTGDAVSLPAGARIFANGTDRELAEFPGKVPPIRAHSLIAETGGIIRRFREFVVYHQQGILPRYVLAYARA